VLYIGKENFPALKVLKLSELFKETGVCDKARLELEVTVYNINKGVNPAIEERSSTLGGYAGLVAKAPLRNLCEKLPVLIFRPSHSLPP
jgi:hypothetical protein